MFINFTIIFLSKTFIYYHLQLRVSLKLFMLIKGAAKKHLLSQDKIIGLRDNSCGFAPVALMRLNCGPSLKHLISNNTSIYFV